MAKPKLALIPASQGSKVFSVLPSDGSGDFDFSRSGKATRINAQGLIETVSSGQSRLNYPLIDGVVSGCPSLLLENSATNLIQYSEDLTQWTTNSNVTITSDSIISPNGTLNADKFEFTGAGVIRPNNSQLTFVDDYAFSIFIKKGNSRYVTLSARFFTSSLAIGFDLETETSQSGGIVEKYSNDWYRLSISNNVTGDADRTGVFYVYLPNALGVESSVSGNYAYAWGAQVVEGSYPTSYIPSLTGSQTTRSAETCNNSGDADTFNDSEGVLMAEISALDDDNTFRVIAISDGGTSNRVVIDYTTSNQIRGFLAIGGDTTARQIIDTNTNIEQVNKIAFKYSNGDFALWVNGIEIGTTSGSNTLPVNTLNRLNFNFGGSSGGEFYGNTKQIQYFDSVLTDSELETLTSWVSFSDMANGQLYTIE